jgi:hypothetical protein
MLSLHACWGWVSKVHSDATLFLAIVSCCVLQVTLQQLAADYDVIVTTYQTLVSWHTVQLHVELQLCSCMHASVWL